MLFSLPFIICLFGLASAAINDRLKIKTWAIYYVATVFLVLFAGLRNPAIFPDMENYEYYFNAQELLVTQYGEDAINIGYSVLSSIGRYLLGDFQLFLLCISFYIVFCYSWFIRKYARNLQLAWIALFLFVIINYCQSLFLLRQLLAMATCLIAFHFIIERKLLFFLLFSFIAISLHTTAIVIIPLYFFYRLKPTRRNMLFFSVGALIGTGLFYLLVSSVLARVGGYYSHYLSYEGGQSWQRALMKVFILFLYVFALGRKSFRPGINYLVFFCLVFSAVLCVGGMNLYGVFRLKEFFSIGEILGIPLIIRSSGFNFTFKKGLVYVMLVLYICLLFVSFKSFVQSDNFAQGFQFFFLS